MGSRRDHTNIALLYSDTALWSESTDWDQAYYKKYGELPESMEQLQDFINDQTPEPRASEDGEDLNPMRQFNYLLSQLSDMKKDLSLGINADSTIFQEIRHVAEQIATWCDDQQA